MKIKRYVLLEDNRFIDTTKRKYFKDSNNYLCMFYDNTNVSYQIGKIKATSDEATDLIRLLDLILTSTGRMILIRSEEQVKYWKAQSHRINKFYKLIGKDYICVWEKE